LDHHRAAAGSAVQSLSGPAQRQGRAPISFSEFNGAVVGDQIKTVNIAGTHVEGQFKNGTQFATDIPDDPSLTTRLP